MLGTSSITPPIYLFNNNEGGRGEERRGERGKEDERGGREGGGEGRRRQEGGKNN